jgi:hypothetical protein
MLHRRAHRHAASARALGQLFLRVFSRVRKRLARSVQCGASLFCPVLAHPSLARADPPPPGVLVRSGHGLYAVADDAASPRVPGKPALAPIRAALSPLAAGRHAHQPAAGACAGKVKMKSHGALARAHLLDLAAFEHSGRLVRHCGGSPRPHSPRCARSARCSNSHCNCTPHGV